MNLSYLCLDDRRSNLTAESSFESRVDSWFLGLEKSEKRNMEVERCFPIRIDVPDLEFSIKEFKRQISPSRASSREYWPSTAPRSIPIEAVIELRFLNSSEMCASFFSFLGHSPKARFTSLIGCPERAKKRRSGQHGKYQTYEKVIWGHYENFEITLGQTLTVRVWFQVKFSITYVF